MVLLNTFFFLISVKNATAELGEDAFDPELSPGLFQGDMALTNEFYNYWRVGVRWDVFPDKLWKNRTVPYVISPLYGKNFVVLLYKYYKSRTLYSPPRNFTEDSFFGSFIKNKTKTITTVVLLLVLNSRMLFLFKSLLQDNWVFGFFASAKEKLINS